VGNDATCGNRAPNAEDPFVFGEEIEVEREAHAECMNARAARDEKPGAGIDAVEMSQPEQAGADPRRERNLPAEHGHSREAPQARCETRFRHAGSRG
jgi:hypothetical protein